MSHWFYYGPSGERVGPITSTALKLLAQQGVISRETVLENQNGRTAIAKDVNGLSFPTQIDVIPQTPIPPSSLGEVYGLESPLPPPPAEWKPSLAVPPTVGPNTASLSVAQKPIDVPDSTVDETQPSAKQHSFTSVPPVVENPFAALPLAKSEPSVDKPVSINPFIAPNPQANQAALQRVPMATTKQTTKSFNLISIFIGLGALLLVSVVIGVGISNSGGSFTPTEQKEIDDFVAIYGNDVRKRMGRGDKTLLHIALDDRQVAIDAGRKPRAWSPAVIRYLVSKGADVNAKTSYGYTPLHFIGGNPLQDEWRIIENAKFLVSKGANIHAKSDGGGTPLHHACAGNVEVVKLLVSKGADVHARSRHGYTPLHQAAELNKGSQGLLIASFLISEGADVNAKDEDGRTPLAVAREFNNWSFIEYFKGLSKANNDR